MNVILVLNGLIDKEYDEKFFRCYDLIVCIDGGYDNFKKLHLLIEPNYIIGDLDSIQNKHKLNYFTEQQIILKDNQDETDSQFAIKFLLKTYKDIKKIDFIYFSSQDRLDHLLCNILLIKQIPKDIFVKLITANQEIYLLKGERKFMIEDKKDKTLSIIPITDIKSITTFGLKWQLNSIDLKFGFIGGISNIIEKDVATVAIKNGECILMVEK